LNTINQIRLLQFRNYSHSSFEFPTKITCIHGENGSGKTNLLDSIYYLCYTKSYFSNSQTNNIQHGTDGFRLDGVFHKDISNSEIISCKWKDGKKEITCNQVAYEKLTDHIGKYPAVMIAPDDLYLINEGSEWRRKWMDSILGQVDKTYLEHLMSYQKILMHRNAWLKSVHFSLENTSYELEYYNQQLPIHAHYIFNTRLQFINVFITILQHYYEQISGGKEKVNLHYRSDLFQHDLHFWLTNNLSVDCRLQRTQKGIHKDEIEFVFDDKLIKQFGSQGQKKSYLFALKLAQYQYLSNVLKAKPILLLDDIFEKLDQRRMEALLHLIQTDSFGQVVLTDTHQERVEQAFGNCNQLSFIHLKA